MASSEYSTISPGALSAYLERHGWNRVSDDALTAVWRLADHDILAPLVKDLADYDAVVATAVARLAGSLNRKPSLVLQDLRAVAYDVLELKDILGIDNLSAIPLKAASTAVLCFERLALGASYATISEKPRATVPSRRPPEVTEFIASLKFGPYTNGVASYALFAPIPLASQMNLFETRQVDESVKDLHFVPFERRVTERLPSYIAAAVDAAIMCKLTSRMQPFEEAVGKGVTVPLLRGIRDLLTILPEKVATVTIEYSPLVPSESRRSPSTIPLLSHDDTKLLQEAIEFLETKEPLDIEEVEGPVISLGRDVEDIQGAVIITAFLQHKPQKVYMRLTEPMYDLAICAHQKRLNVVVMGTLRREGRRLWLDEPSQFRLMWDDEERSNRDQPSADVDAE